MARIPVIGVDTRPSGRTILQRRAVAGGQTTNLTTKFARAPFDAGATVA